MRVLTGDSMSARSKFARECDVACGRYHSYNVNLIFQITYVYRGRYILLENF